MKRVIEFSIGIMVALAFISGAIAQEVKIGTLLAHSGPLKEWGPHIQNGAVLAANQLNGAGSKFILIHEDSKTSAIPATEAARKLVEVDQVIAIVGALASSSTQLVAEQVTCPDNVILISPASTSPMLTILPADHGKDFLFRTCPSDVLQGIVAGKLAADSSKTASVIYIDNPYGQGLVVQFKKSFEKRRGKVLAMVPHGDNAAETYKNELNKALSGKPDILCAFSYPEHAKVYLKEAIELFQYRKFLFCDGSKSEEIVNVLGADNVEGQMGTAPGSAEGNAHGVFRAAYEQEFGRLPALPFISNAYDGMAVIGLAAYATKVKGLELTSKNIRDHLRHVANPPGEIVGPGEFKKAYELLNMGKEINYEGAAGSVDFDEHGDVVTPIEVWKYSKGNIVTVKIENNIPVEEDITRQKPGLTINAIP